MATLMMEAEEAARDVLARCAITKEPVNPILVAQTLGFDVFWTRFDKRGVHGRSAINQGHVRIEIEESDPRNRRTFTIAHEIGHAVLHLTGASAARFEDGKEAGMYERTDYDGTYDQKEVEANNFAGALLMPEDWVRERWRDCKDVAELAAAFDVSVEAMKRRLAILSLV